jgi:tRNA-2-methylthio-N6-dimethylallyladenosine synthase
MNEIQLLAKEGYKEITLLGQNVNSYNWQHKENTTNFSKLLDEAASKNPTLRFRFATSHPKDLSDEIIKTMARHPNICKHIHLPVQSGSSKILKKMNRKYSREWYTNRIDAIKKHLPDAEITTDIMTGFCSETEEDHQETLSLMKYVQYDYAYMFKYSERPGTKAAQNMEDDVPEETKKRRLNEIIDLQTKISEKNKLETIGKSFEVLIEGTSKKSEDEHFGRNSQNQVVVFPKNDEKIGDIVEVKIEKATPATLIGKKVKS